MHWQWVDDAASLQACCAELAHASALAIDTEFIRQTTYHPQLCLVQLAADQQVYLIDTLAPMDLTPLVDLLSLTNQIKIVHSAQQDIEALHHHLGIWLAPFFDSQIAMELLGFGHQISYAQLIEHWHHITLDKSLSRTDWRKRPLSADALRYASLDVWYLPAIYQQLTQQLQQQHRLDWLEQECQQLLHTVQYPNTVNQLWYRWHQVDQLSAQQQRLLYQLLSWREINAQQRNRPRQWIVANQTIDQLIHTTYDAAAIQQILDKKRTLLTVKQVLQFHQQDQSSLCAVLKPISKAHQRALNTWIKQQAHQLQLPPQRILSRHQGKQLLHGELTVDQLFTGWRKPLVDKALFAIVNRL